MWYKMNKPLQDFRLVTVTTPSLIIDCPIGFDSLLITSLFIIYASSVLEA